MIALDTEWRDCKGRYDKLNKAKNLHQKEVTKAKKAGGEDPENAAKIKEVSKEIELVKVLEGEKICAKLLRIIEAWSYSTRYPPPPLFLVFCLIQCHVIKIPSKLRSREPRSQ